MGLDYNISNNEQQFVLDALKENTRLDGRKLLDMRNVEIQIFPDEYGHVDVKLGKTEVACKISASIEQPYKDRPFEGLFQINTEISPMCSPFFEVLQGAASGTSSRQTSEEILISRMIEKSVRRSNALDLENLCLVAGSKCWSVRADLHFLNYDGNFIDASCIAVMTALLHFKKPDVEVSGDDIVVFDTKQRDPVPLSILHIPLCVTFNFYNPNGDEENIKGESNGELIVVDTNLIEERLSLGSMTITLNKNQEVCQLLKSGGLNIDASLIMNCCTYAAKIVSQLTDQIHRVLKDDEHKRINPIKQKELQTVNSREAS